MSNSTLVDSASSINHDIFDYRGVYWEVYLNLLAFLWKVLTNPELYFTFSVAVLSICLNIYLVHRFIFRLLANTEKGKPTILKTTMMKIDLPFSVRLIPAKCTYEEVSVEVCASKDYHLIVLWGASISSLFESLKQSTDLSDETFVCCQKSDTITNSAHNSSVITLKPPDVNGPFPDLQSDIRDFYPLVVILARTSAVSDKNETVSLLTIIHIKDDFFVNPSSVLGQYIKVSDGRVFNLMRIFFSSCPEPDDSGEVQEFCVVCQSLPLNCAILPCRHACLCSECLVKLKHCPICRGQMEHYFIINDSDVQVHAVAKWRWHSGSLSLDSLNYRQ